MTLKSMSVALAVSALVALSGPAIARDKSGPNIDTTLKGTPGGASSLAMAQQLYDIGMANKDGLTVLVAARIAAAVDAKDGPEVKKITKGESAAESPDPTNAPVDAATMIASAKDLAGEDDTLLGLIEDAESEGARGSIGGAMRHLSSLPGGMTDVWEVPFYGSSYAELAIIGDGDSNLDVLVADETGNTICYDVSWSDKVSCDFVPAWNGYFYITVQNTGTTRNSYYLLTN
jgi:hypothetical protein